MLRGERHEPLLGRALEALLEGSVRLLAASEERECLAEIEPGALERRVEHSRTFEDGEGFLRPLVLQEEESEVLIRFREGGRGLDDVAERALRFLAPVQLDEQRAKKGL